MISILPRSLRPLLGLAALALFPALLPGCSSRDGVLATVGTRSVTADQFLEAARRMQGQYPGPPDTAKTLLYEDLFRRALLLEQAERSGLLVDSLVDQYRENVESEALRNALFEKLVPRDVPVSEGEARQLHAWRDSATRLQIVYAVEEPLARAAFAEIARGADFAAVADRVNLPGLLPPGGVLDYLTPGSLVDPLDRILRAGRPGELIGPLEAPGEGWFVVRVLDRRPHDPGPWDEQEFALMQAIQQRKRRVLSLRAFAMLRDAYRIEVDRDGIQAMFAYFNRDYGPLGGLPELDPAQRDVVLARYDGGPARRGTYTFAAAIRDLEADPRERPNPSMLPSFTQWVESQMLQKVAVLEARRRRLHEEPELRRRIDERVNNYLLEGIYDTLVVRQAEARPEDVEAAYRRRAAALTRMPAATVQYLVVPDSMAAARVAELARRAPTLREAIVHSSPGLPVREQSVRFPTDDAHWASLESRLRLMSPGEFGAPVPLQGGWMVYQLVDKQQFVEPFENLPAEARQALQAEAEELARERRLNELTDSLRHSLPVREYRDRLRRLPWPVTSEGSTGMAFPG